MEMVGWSGRIFVLCQWISRLAYVNLLWLLFMAAGLLVLGAAPATAAMFAVIRKWIHHDNNEADAPIFQTFWTAFKKEFWPANRLGLLLAGIGLVLYADWRLISSMEGALYPILMGCLIGGALLFAIVLVYIFPVFVHYENKTLQHVKTAFVLGISYPLYTAVMLLAVVSAMILSLFFTGIGLLFFGSGLSYVLMYTSHQLFTKLTNKYQTHTS